MFGFSKKQLLIIAVIVIVALRFKPQLQQLPVVGSLVG